MGQCVVPSDRDRAGSLRRQGTLPAPQRGRRDPHFRRFGRAGLQSDRPQRLRSSLQQGPFSAEKCQSRRPDRPVVRGCGEPVDGDRPAVRRRKGAGASSGPLFPARHLAAAVRVRAGSLAFPAGNGNADRPAGDRRHGQLPRETAASCTDAGCGRFRARPRSCGRSEAASSRKRFPVEGGGQRADGVFDRTRSHRRRLAVAGAGKHAESRADIFQSAGADGGISGLQIRRLAGIPLSSGQKTLSGTVRKNPCPGARGPLGDPGRHVRRGRLQSDLRRIHDPSVPARQKFLLGRVRSRGAEPVAAGCVRVFRRDAADHPESLLRLFPDPENLVEPGQPIPVSHFPLDRGRRLGSVDPFPAGGHLQRQGGSAAADQGGRPVRRGRFPARVHEPGRDRRRRRRPFGKSSGTRPDPARSARLSEIGMDFRLGLFRTDRTIPRSAAGMARGTVSGTAPRSPARNGATGNANRR